MMLPTGSVVGTDPAAPDFFRRMVGLREQGPARRPDAPATRQAPAPARRRGRYSRVYCGSGSLIRCRSALRASLADALPVTRQQVYGRGACASNAQSSCFDRNRWVVASAIDLDAFPFQNRPTFQQVVELTRSAGR